MSFRRPFPLHDFLDLRDIPQIIDAPDQECDDEQGCELCPVFLEYALEIEHQDHDETSDRSEHGASGVGHEYKPYDEEEENVEIGMQ